MGRKPVQHGQPLGGAHIGPCTGVDRSTDFPGGDGGAKHGRQSRHGTVNIAARHFAPRPLEKFAPVQADGAVGEARFGLIEEKAGGIQPEVAQRVVCRVGHQPEVGQLIAGDEPGHLGVIEHKIRRVDVARQHPEHIAQMRQRPSNPTCCFQRSAEIPTFV